MADTIYNFESRLHQFVHPSNSGEYNVYLAEAEAYIATAPQYLITKWEREFAHKGFSAIIPSGPVDSDFNILAQDGSILLFQNGDSAIYKV